MKLGCMICGDLHKANEKHFPVTKFGEREVFKDGEKVKEKYVQGYICRKCLLKDLKRRQREQEARDARKV
jgi:hypothetical protein